MFSCYWLALATNQCKHDSNRKAKLQLVTMPSWKTVNESLITHTKPAADRSTWPSEAISIMKTDHGEGPTRDSDTGSDYLEHRGDSEDHHEQKEDVGNRPSEREWECGHCLRKFSSSTKFQKHNLEEHQDAAPWKCEICKKNNKTWILLRQHRKIHFKDIPCSYSVRTLTLSPQAELKAFRVAP